MRHPRPLVSSILCLALVLVPGLLATPGPASAGEDEKVQIKFENPVGMEDFLRTVAKVTQLPLVWNPQDKNIRGKEVLGGLDITATKGKLMEVVRSLLTFYELVIIPVGPQGHQIQLVVDARQTSAILKLKPEYVDLNDRNLAAYENQDGMFITTTIVVEHMTDLRNARNALTRVVTGQNIGNVTEVPSANAFVVTDFAPNVVAIYRLLKTMDKPSTSSSTTGGQTVSISLEFAKAVDVAAVLSQHFGARAPGAAQQRGVLPAGPNAPRITADARTNQVLISGTEDEIDKVKDAIRILDIRVPAEAPQSAHFVRLTNIRADQAAQALVDLIEQTGGHPGALQKARPVVVAHVETNALLISASDEDHARLRALIEEMDSKAP